MGESKNRLFFVACALLLLAVATFVWIKSGPWPGGSDSSGYFNHARLLIEGKAREQLRVPAHFDSNEVNPWMFTTLGMRPAGNPPLLAPTYAVGLPLFLAGGMLVFDGLGPRIVLTAIAVFAVAVTLWLLVLCGVGPLWALLSGIILALNAIFIFQALQPMSDVLSLACCTLAVCLALKSRTHELWALAGGAAIGVAVLVRSPNVLIILPVLVVLGARWRLLLLLGLGGLPFAIFLGLDQWLLYGSPYETGYGDYSQVLGSSFKPSHVPPILSHFSLWLGRTFGWFVPLLALPGLLFGNAPLRTRAALAVWLLAFLAFYSSYQASGEPSWALDRNWPNLRFLLPLYPALLASAALCFERLSTLSYSEAIPTQFRNLVAGSTLLLIVVVSAFISLHWTRELGVTSIADGEHVYVETADWVKRNLPSNAVILCMQVSGALLYLSPNALLRYDQLSGAQWEYVQRWHRDHGIPIYAALFPFEYSDTNVLDKFTPGKWSQVGEARHVRLFRLED